MSSTFADLFSELEQCSLPTTNGQGGNNTPLCWGLWEFVAFATYCALAAIITGNYSHTDRVWSITPVVYAWTWAGYADFDARTTIMAVISLYWGCRLTYNFWRKGGYNKGDEDYRWPYLRKTWPLTNPVCWHVFNITFIAGYQHLLLFLIACPAYVAATRRGEPLNWCDALAIVLSVGFLTLETVADQQQWVFQQAKHGKRDKDQEAIDSGDYERGFLTRGLFKYSRHPNFFAEQSVWWSFYVFGVAALGPDKTEHWFNWTLIAPVLLSLLFQGSTPFTEKITAEKYPNYKEYQRCTSALIPLPRFSEPVWTDTVKVVN